MPDGSKAETAPRPSASTEAAPDRAASVADSMQESARICAELAQYIGYFLSAKIDQLKLGVRTLILYAVLGILGAAAAATILVVAVVLLFTGAAHGLGEALGGREWLGDLIVGIVVLGAIATAMAIFLSKFKTASRRGTMRKYEDRRKQQREQFGTDVAQRAGE